MSRTLKTRPSEIAYNDPRNRHVRHWKQITSCKRSGDRCCYKWRANADNPKRRHGWKRELLTLD